MAMARSAAVSDAADGPASLEAARPQWRPAQQHQPAGASPSPHHPARITQSTHSEHTSVTVVQRAVFSEAANRPARQSEQPARRSSSQLSSTSLQAHHPARISQPATSPQSSVTVAWLLSQPKRTIQAAPAVTAASATIQFMATPAMRQLSQHTSANTHQPARLQLFSSTDG